jgi:hypothetical protein
MLLNYTSKVPPEQTISEIQRMLSGHGVTAMMTEYDGPHVAAVSFRMNIDGKPLGFRLPRNWKAVATILTPKRERNIYDKKKLAAQEEARKQQAIRTAWRIIKDWAEAQLALVEVSMVTVPQVFLPYAIMKDGRTLSEHVSTDPSFLLGDGQ